MLDMHFDYLLVGGGLQNSLIALAVLEASPAARLAIVEQAAALGGNHTWCFHSDDISPAATSFVEPLVAHRWPGYEVAFPRLARSLSTPYAAVTCASLDRTMRARVDAAPNATLLLGARAESVTGDGAVLADGRRLTAELVIDARGPERCAVADAHTGYQKFVGLEVSVSVPHGRDRPFLMDATVEQVDGFRFVYTLPLGPDRLLIEDTYFSDTPTLNVGKITAEVHAYAATRGYQIDKVIRTERGVLPLPWAGAYPAPAEGPLVAGYQGGWFHPVTGYSFPVAVRLAEYVANTPLGEVFGPGLAAMARAHHKQLAYCYRLNKMLFQWFAPADRYNVLERFYRLPEATIRRFYALTLTAGDRARIVFGRPPRGLSLRAALRGRSVR